MSTQPPDPTSKQPEQENTKQQPLFLAGFAIVTIGILVMAIFLSIITFSYSRNANSCSNVSISYSYTRSLFYTTTIDYTDLHTHCFPTPYLHSRTNWQPNRFSNKYSHTDKYSHSRTWSNPCLSIGRKRTLSFGRMDTCTRDSADYLHGGIP